MSYEKTIWVDGDTINATRLNKIQNGIDEVANNYGGLIVNGRIDFISSPNVKSDSTQEAEVLDKTFNEIKTAVQNGRFVYYKPSKELIRYNYNINGLYSLAGIVSTFYGNMVFFSDMFFTADENGLLYYTLSELAPS